MLEARAAAAVEVLEEPGRPRARAQRARRNARRCDGAPRAPAQRRAPGSTTRRSPAPRTSCRSRATWIQPILAHALGEMKREFGSPWAEEDHRRVVAMWVQLIAAISRSRRWSASCSAKIRSRPPPSNARPSSLRKLARLIGGRGARAEARSDSRSGRDDEMKLSEVNLNDLDALRARLSARHVRSAAPRGAPCSGRTEPRRLRLLGDHQVHDDLKQISRRPIEFSSERQGSLIRDPDPGALAFIQQVMPSMDPPKHRNYRMPREQGVHAAHGRRSAPAHRADVPARS